MDYQSWRAAAIRNLYAGAIRDLVARYRRGQPTVVLLPGGMGSELDRSLAAHTPRAAPPQVFDTVWADVGILFNQDALTLEIDGQGRDRDPRDHPERPARLLRQGVRRHRAVCGGPRLEFYDVPL